MFLEVVFSNMGSRRERLIHHKDSCSSTKRSKPWAPIRGLSQLVERHALSLVHCDVGGIVCSPSVPSCSVCSAEAPRPSSSTLLAACEAAACPSQPLLSCSSRLPGTGPKGSWGSSRFKGLGEQEGGAPLSPKGNCCLSRMQRVSPQGLSDTL